MMPFLNAQTWSLPQQVSSFDPDGENIDTPPPHCKEGMENEHIADAMQLTYGGIVKEISRY